MKHKRSDKLYLLIKSQPDFVEVTLHVLPKKNIDSQSEQKLLESLKKISTEKDSLRNQMGVFVLKTNLRSIDKIEKMTDVDWIDIEKNATIEELLDNSERNTSNP